MIAPVALSRSTRNSENTQNLQIRFLSRRVPRFLRVLRYGFIVIAAATSLFAHDFERTQVTLTFARDGAFVVDVANDAAWLRHRLIPFGDAPFADRVVLFVDGHEVRPSSAEYIAGDPVATYRLRGRVPPASRSLRWYYGLPMDPYPLTIRRADGRVFVEEIAGDAWSRPIDLTGQFQAPRVSGTIVAFGIALLLSIPIALRFATVRRAGSFLRGQRP
jgi:hypothetical protein